MRYDHDKFDQAVNALDLSSWEEVGALLIGMGITGIEPENYYGTSSSYWYCCRCPIAQYFHKLEFSTAYATRSLAGIDIDLDDDYEIELPATAKEFIHVHDRISSRY